jgi:hypothetical protein
VHYVSRVEILESLRHLVELRIKYCVSERLAVFNDGGATK